MNCELWCIAFADPCSATYFPIWTHSLVCTRYTYCSPYVCVSFSIWPSFTPAFTYLSLMVVLGGSTAVMPEGYVLDRQVNRWPHVLTWAHMVCNNLDIAVHWFIRQSAILIQHQTFQPHDNHFCY